MKEWYQMTGDEALEALHASREGLTGDGAKQALERFGPNALKEGKKETVLQVFLSQFKDLMVIILIIAAAISMMTGDVESTLVIFAVLILNAVLGTVQHVKAQKSLDALKALSSPTAKVLRDGERIEIDSKDVVPGDIFIAEAGDLIVADGRILENYSLQVNESSLTGESTNVDKGDEALAGEKALADRKNMVYSGALVTYGRAVILVTETGMNTEIGKIATLMNETKEKRTPLQRNLDDFSKKLATAILIISAVVFALGVFRHMAVLDALLFAVALAVAAIPEALSSIVTIVQAMGTQKMAKQNAVIKKLAAVESLGSVSVICSDKTGTLTQNKMTVQQVYVGGRVLEPGEMDMTQKTHRYLLFDAVLANDSTISDGKGIGDPTEYALLELYDRVRKEAPDGDLLIPYEDLREDLARSEEVPFDSDRKLMSTKHMIEGVNTVFTKGAVDVLLERCDRIRMSDGDIRPVTEEIRAAIAAQNQAFSENGLRVLAFAYKESDEVLNLDTEYHYTFLGLISEMDPPREESKLAVQHASEAGIRTIMITGDHKVTATAIAKQIGIFRDGDIAVTGMELDAMTDQELDGKIERISVYARVSPENKIRIVDAWQRKGRIVSMTGDGVNDAPALKKADIGVAMGITGTEVSKDAASMILEDDNFATIIKAVANGSVPAGTASVHQSGDRLAAGAGHRHGTGSGGCTEAEAAGSGRRYHGRHFCKMDDSAGRADLCCGVRCLPDRTGGESGHGMLSCLPHTDLRKAAPRLQLSGQKQHFPSRIPTELVQPAGLLCGSDSGAAGVADDGGKNAVLRFLPEPGPCRLYRRPGADPDRDHPDCEGRDGEPEVICCGAFPSVFPTDRCFCNGLFFCLAYTERRGDKK